MHKLTVYGYVGGRSFKLELLLNNQDFSELMLNGLKHAVTPKLVGPIQHDSVQIHHVTSTYVPTERFKIDP